MALLITRADGVNFTTKVTTTTLDTVHFDLVDVVIATGVTSTNGVEGTDPMTYEIVLTAGSTSLTLDHTLDSDSDYTADR